MKACLEEQGKSLENLRVVLKEGTAQKRQAVVTLVRSCLAAGGQEHDWARGVQPAGRRLADHEAVGRRAARDAALSEVKSLVDNNIGSLDEAFAAALNEVRVVVGASEAEAVQVLKEALQCTAGDGACDGSSVKQRLGGQDMCCAGLPTQAVDLAGSARPVVGSGAAKIRGSGRLARLWSPLERSTIFHYIIS